MPGGEPSPGHAEAPPGLNPPVGTLPLPGVLPPARGQPESIGFLEQIINCIADPIFVKDDQHRLVLVNDAECALAGKRREELLGRTDRDLIPADLRVIAWRQDDHVIETGQETISEDEIPDAQGSVRTVITRKARLVDSAGRRLVVGIIRDITERKQAERALQAAKDYAENLIETANTMVVGLDINGNVRIFNHAAEKITGYTRAELAGRSWFEVIVPRDRYPEVWEEFLRLTAASITDEFENPILTKSGEERYIVWRNSQLMDHGQIAGTISFGIDITERKRAEERLTTLVAAVGQTVDDIVVIDLEGNIQYVNSAFERTTGYAAVEALGRNVNDLLCRGLDETLIPRIWETIRAGRSWKGRFANRAKEGRLILLDASVSAIRDASDRIVGYVSARRDVTRQVEMEEHAARADKLEAIGTLAGGIAHDFNNNLSAIIGHTQMAQMKCPAGSAIHRNLQAVLEGSQRAADLVRQILAFSRQERREEKLTEVNQVVAEAAKFLRATIPSTIEVRTDIRADAAVLGDPTDVHRIVVNLCTNAAHAMREHGGLLEIGLEEADVGAAFAAGHSGMAPGPFVRLTVRDTGCGMTREVMAHVFEPFFTTREPGEGTGMGLSVVHGIVTGCHGAISVESEPGRGTVFDVYLPAIRQGPPAAAPASEAILRGTERILLVDDEPLVRDTLADMLRGLGYQVRACSSGAEALAAFEADRAAVDLVVTDMTMPGMTGDSLARRLKRIRPDLPVVLCTGHSERVSVETAKAQGVDELLMKPVLMSDLSRLVRKVVESRAAFPLGLA